MELLELMNCRVTEIIVRLRHRHDINRSATFRFRFNVRYVSITSSSARLPLAIGVNTLIMSSTVDCLGDNSEGGIIGGRDKLHLFSFLDIYNGLFIKKSTRGTETVSKDD